MPHTWVVIRLGRICSECQLVQAKHEFGDAVPPCPHDNPAPPEDLKRRRIPATPTKPPDTLHQ